MAVWPTITDRSATNDDYYTHTDMGDGNVKHTRNPTVTVAGTVINKSVFDAIKAYVDALPAQTSSTVVTLESDGWTGESSPWTQTVTATGVTATNFILTDADPDTVAAFDAAGIYCAAQGAGTLMFWALKSEPASDIDVKVVIMR